MEPLYSCFYNGTAELSVNYLLNQHVLVWDRSGLGDDHCKVVAGLLLLVKINRELQREQLAVRSPCWEIQR